MNRKPERSGFPLDDVSKAIIEQLQQDGRRSYAAIGKVVGLSEAAVRQRVQRLIDGGVMQVVAVTDPLELGFARQAMVGIRVTGPLEPVADALAALDEVDYVVITAGTYDLLAEVVCESDDAPARADLRARSAPSRASPRPRRSCTSSCASRPTRGVFAEPLTLGRTPLGTPRRHDRRRPLAGRPRRRRRRRRRRVHRAVDRLLPRRGRPVAADRGARGRDRGVRRVAAATAAGARRCSRRRLSSLAPARRPRVARWPSTPRCATPSTRSAGSPRPRASTPTWPRAAPSRWPATAPSWPGPAPRSPTPGRGAAARTTSASSTPTRPARCSTATGTRRGDVHPGLRGDPPAAAGARAGRRGGAPRRAAPRADAGCTAIEPGRVAHRRTATVRAGDRDPGDRGLHRHAAPAHRRTAGAGLLADHRHRAAADATSGTRSGWRRRETFTDHRHLIIYGQRTADDRLVFGGRGAPYHFGSRIRPGVRPRRPGLRRAARDPGRPVPGARAAPGSRTPGAARSASRATGAPRSAWTATTGLGWAGGYVGDGVEHDQPRRPHAARPRARPRHRADPAAVGRPPLPAAGSPSRCAGSASTPGCARWPGRRRGAADPPPERRRARPSRRCSADRIGADDRRALVRRPEPAPRRGAAHPHRPRPGRPRPAPCGSGRGTSRRCAPRAGRPSRCRRPTTARTRPSSRTPSWSTATSR